MGTRREEQEIDSWELVKRMARMTDPKGDAEDDADTLLSLIQEARAIVRGE